MATVTLYDHTRLRFLSGVNDECDSYTTKAAAESGATQLSTANGYTEPVTS